MSADVSVKATEVSDRTVGTWTIDCEVRTGLRCVAPGDVTPV
jgi:hypothetical protein